MLYMRGTITRPQYGGDMEIAFAYGTEVGRVQHIKLLGLIVTDDLTWHGHSDYLCGKASPRLYFLRMLGTAGVDPSDLVRIGVALIRSIIILVNFKVIVCFIVIILSVLL